MKKALIILLLVCFATTGCTGSFNLTKKVYNAHRSQDDKWADEIMFLICVMVPVYSIATFADAVIFNSIEFWTGENPVDSVKADTNEKFVKAGDIEGTMSYDPQSKRITVTAPSASAAHPVIQLEKLDGVVRVNDANGNLLYTATKNQKGELVVYDSNLELVKNYSPSQIEKIKETYAK
ncbi:MAG TPA: DUF3332 family protein [Candidatus Omnitrophota bacterium]|nr:DUF3332 family protein [Candidatus Omnitrophota bacterium]